MDELIKRYAAQIRQINADGTEGAGTWEGMLADFARAAHIEKLAAYRESLPSPENWDSVEGHQMKLARQ